MKPEMKELSLSPLAHYAITYEPCPPLLRGCNSRRLSAEEITETCELLLATARHYACRYWLLDGRSHQQAQPQALHDWMRDEYFPRISRELGSGACLCFLVPEPVWAGLPALGYGQLQNGFVHGVRMGWFTDEVAALDWLAKQRA
ncbi:hypothetical protein D0N36_14880 [Hymenobacter lapidiphilus]|nr:hypothetical protein D0N36_14880 [Hymenobacter sp. CCM 8763]